MTASVLRVSEHGVAGRRDGDLEEGGATGAGLWLDTLADGCSRSYSFDDCCRIRRLGASRQTPQLEGHSLAGMVQGV
eukprot:7085401-Prymnesium_polylepis.1